MAGVNLLIDRVDPLDLDLDDAGRLAEIERASFDAAGLDIPASVGASTLASLRLGCDSRPADGLWLARRGKDVVGHVMLEVPWRDNTDAAYVRGAVHPDARRRGVGRALVDRAVSMAGDAGRSKVYSGAYEGCDGIPALVALGFSRAGSAGLGVNTVRRLVVHGAPSGHWDRPYDEALAHAGDYELMHQVGPTPEAWIEAMVTLHDAINDAPLDDPELDKDVWDADRVRCYDRAMAGRRQTVYRVMARHRESGDWAGQSLLCVDELLPKVAFQEDTSVVRAHRGHRLGLLMKADMLRWVGHDRPEIEAIDTWNALTNEHMVAVNERLGTTIVARHVTFRLRD